MFLLVFTLYVYDACVYVCVSLCPMCSKQADIEMSSSVASQSLSCEKSPLSGLKLAILAELAGL